MTEKPRRAEEPAALEISRMSVTVLDNLKIYELSAASAELSIFRICAL